MTAPINKPIGNIGAGAFCIFMLSAPVSTYAADVALGVIAGMSGLGSSYGIGIAQGAEMAVREINAGGGINGRQVRILSADDASAPARSAVAMRRLIAQNVDLIVGGWGSAQVLANMEIAEEAGVPYIVVGATHPSITSANNRWVFRVIQSDSVMAEQLARIVAERLGLKRIAIINDTNAYGTGNRDIFVRALARTALTPVEIQSYQSADKDFTAQLIRIKAANPDGIAIFGTIPAAPTIMNQARALGIRGRFLGTGGLANETLITLALTASEGTLLMSYFNDDADDEAASWAHIYKTEFASRSEPPRPILAAWEYRAIRFIAAPCLRLTDGDRERLRSCIAAWRGRPFGLTEEVYFDETGQLVQPPFVVEVSGSAFRSWR